MSIGVTLVCAGASSVMTGGSPVAAADTGSISGTVTDATTGEPIEGMVVRSHESSAQAVSAADGSYTIGGLAAGEYTVYFDEPLNVDDYAFEWYDDSLTREGATLVTVGGGQAVTAVDAALTPRWCHRRNRDLRGR